ncbi:MULTISPECIES: hypothetical protein [unclassified Iodidimonas]|jgi:hypothetical protein|uniref:hypothetical protein n=1 Tax=unclassified Iodidimonas TaxID=2626145 RepID=UPI0024826E25|nr:MULTISPECIES: hypothetical protein [unclassified Iodidimonas]
MMVFGNKIRSMLIGLFLVFWASGALADPVLEAVRAEAASISADDYRLIRIYTDNSGKTRQRRAAYDPTRPDGEEWLLLERNEEPPSDKYLRKYEQSEERGAPETYGRILNYLDGEVSLLSRTKEQSIYQIRRLGVGSILLEGDDISDRISGEAVIDTRTNKPLVTEIRLKVEESFKPHWLVRIHEGTGVIRFERLADGTPVIRQQSLAVSGGQPFGSIDYRVEFVYQDYQPVREDRPLVKTLSTAKHRP